jgi:hypothetical protein
VSRHHGRNGSVYLSVTSGALPSPCAFQASWSLNKVVDKQDVTAFGDGNKIYVAGLPDASGDFSGFWDDQTAQTYTAATDGLARGLYLYPDLQNAPSVYFFGNVLPDFSIDGAVAGPVNFKSTWNAATKITQYNPALGGLS